MKKLIALSLSILTLAGCGSSKPEASDVQAFLEPFFQACKNIKVVDVKKTNGYQSQNDSNFYTVEFEYSIGFKKQSDWDALVKTYREEEKQEEPFVFDMDEVAKDVTYINAEAKKHRLNGDQEKVDQAIAAWNAAQKRRHEIDKRHDAFVQTTKVLKNTKHVVSSFFLEGCDMRIATEFVPAYLIPAKELKFVQSKDPEDWISLDKPTFTGKVMMRKTDNGWRRV